jgi:hypothetical protein
MVGLVGWGGKKNSRAFFFEDGVKKKKPLSQCSAAQKQSWPGSC